MSFLPPWRRPCLAVVALCLLWAAGGQAFSEVASAPLGAAHPVGRLALAARGSLARLALGEKEAAREARQSLEHLAAAMTSGAPPYDTALGARALAEGSLAFRERDPAFSRQMQTASAASLGVLTPWLGDYPQMVPVHGFDEPAWVRGQPDTVSQAVLALVALERLESTPQGRQALSRWAEGLARLLRPSSGHYPFGAHQSLAPPVPAADSPMAATPPWIVERNYAAAALAEAGRLLDNSAWIESAEREGLGLLAHLVASGRPVYGFAPRPEVERPTPAGAAALAENLMALYRVTGKPVYAILGGLGGGALSRLPPQAAAFADARSLILAACSGTPAAPYLEARDLRPPFTYQVMEAEDGRAVRKAFEALEAVYPGGTPGKIAVVGQENMFWNRFDVEREDDYLFYLVLARQPVSGALVSVSMRIDGDQVHQVSIGGSQDTAYLDMEQVTGPRHLRQGPHSFGIRFSGLLLRRPAMLDCVVVQPVVERRWLALPGGRRALLLKNINEAATLTRVEELALLPSASGGLAAPLVAVDGQGRTVAARFSSDKKKRPLYEAPPGGVAVWEWQEADPSSGQP
jgi:hypothetical protein